MKILFCLCVAGLISIGLTFLLAQFSRDLALMASTLIGAALGCLAVVIGTLWKDRSEYKQRT